MFWATVERVDSFHNCIHSVLRIRNENRRTMRPASGVLAEINRWVLFYPILAAEFVDPPRGINQFLLAGVEGVTGRAHVNMQVLGEG